MKAKKSKTSESKMKKMYAAVQAIYDLKDPEDTEVTIIGVYASKQSAQKARDEAEKLFLQDFMYDDSDGFDIDEARSYLEDDCDHIYNWYVSKVEVES